MGLLPAMTRQRFRLSGGTELSYFEAGEKSKPAVLLLHGFPNSARMFQEVMPGLSQIAYVIAPDLPGFGESDVLPRVSFEAFGEAISELLSGLAIGQRYIYLHDFGAPVGFHIAMQAPERTLGLIIQNANAPSNRIRPGLGRHAGVLVAAERRKRSRGNGAPDTRRHTRPVHLRSATGSDCIDPLGTLGRGLAGDEPARPHGNPACAHRRLRTSRRAVRCHRRLPRNAGNRLP